ncbi:FtsX-like permease family protein [Actinoplanes couchii]|uniref:ABC3 transporter permease C-terminal domain-containing protein n=1 Tax=Actinoplanes couchii TaxID=403638 RepID=A0ABQ3XSA2_9ACTN|nr:FtsX-like permease family protein [Actinoplanes couchii]MDR6318747.1 hypothetical protein [Actinoplanes couchii]GID61275.1 hypothetical protein Aco03nite_096790 [Actinoplanes couchii]
MRPNEPPRPSPAVQTGRGEDRGEPVVVGPVQGLRQVAGGEQITGGVTVTGRDGADAFAVGTLPKKLPLDGGVTVNLPKKTRPAVLTGTFAQDIGTAVLLTPAAAPAALSRVSEVRVTLGATVILLLMGLGLLLDVADRLHDRRKLIGALAAIGASRATIVWSSVAQAMVPVLAVLVLAVATGAIVGTVLMRMDGIPVRFDPGPLLTPVVGGLTLILVCTVAGLLPAARRLTSNEELRQE